MTRLLPLLLAFLLTLTALLAAAVYLGRASNSGAGHRSRHQQAAGLRARKAAWERVP